MYSINRKTRGRIKLNQEELRIEAQRLQYSGPWAKQLWGGKISSPGTYSSFVKHPFFRKEALEAGIVHEHRFAFTFWNKWRRESHHLETLQPPALVSIDWHQDLQHPSIAEKESLLALNTSDETEVALFAWTQLNPVNDGQILAAAWLDIVGDVIVLCKQGRPEKFKFKTRNNLRQVKVFHDTSKFIRALAKTADVILDIDLDYFIGIDGGEPTMALTSKAEMERLLHPKEKLLKILAPKLKGITVALEPKHCGGIRNAHKLFGRLNSLMFDNTLLSEQARWRHPRFA